MKKLFLLFFLVAHVALAEVKISQLPSGSAAGTTSADVFPFVNNSLSLTEKMTLWDLPNLPPFQDLQINSLTLATSITRGATNQILGISGGTATSNGGAIQLYGASYGGAGSEVRMYNGGTQSFRLTAAHDAYIGTDDTNHIYAYGNNLTLGNGSSTSGLASIIANGRSTDGTTTLASQPNTSGGAYITVNGSAASNASQVNIVGSGGLTVNGAAVQTAWTSYSPTISNGPSVTSTSYYYRIVGKQVEVYGQFGVTAAGAASVMRISLPGSVTANTTVAPVNTAIGSVYYFKSGTGGYPGTAIWYDATGFALVSASSTSNALLGSSFANGDVISFQVSMPIQ